MKGSENFSLFVFNTNFYMSFKERYYKACRRTKRSIRMSIATGETLPADNITPRHRSPQISKLRTINEQ